MNNSPEMILGPSKIPPSVAGQNIQNGGDNNGFFKPTFNGMGPIEYMEANTSSETGSFDPYANSQSFFNYPAGPSNASVSSSTASEPLFLPNTPATPSPNASSPNAPSPNAYTTENWALPKIIPFLPNTATTATTATIANTANTATKRNTTETFTSIKRATRSTRKRLMHQIDDMGSIIGSIEKVLFSGMKGGDMKGGGPNDYWNQRWNTQKLANNINTVSMPDPTKTDEQAAVESIFHKPHRYLRKLTKRIKRIETAIKLTRQ